MEVLNPEFRHEDSRRILKQLITDDIKQVNLYECETGAILGDHFHKETTEYFYIVSGFISYNDLYSLNEGTFFRVNPLELHTIRCLSKTTLMTFLTRPFKQDDQDIWKES